MKFSVTKTLSGGRFGLIDGVDRIANFAMETPGFFLYTRGGSVPHVTPDIFKQIVKGNVGFYFPVPNIINFHERMKKFKGSIGEFAGLADQISYIGIIDSGQERVKGYHVKNRVSVWGKQGRSEITVEKFMDMVEALQPDMFLALCDGDTEMDSPNKRIVKSVDRTLDFFEKCMDHYQKSQMLKNSKVLGALEGGYNEELREKCSELMGKSSVFGVVIDGLHNCSKEVSEIDISQVKPMIRASLKHIPVDKLRICHGSWNPKTVLQLIAEGVDILDSSYPYFVAEEGGAFIFTNDLSLVEDNKHNYQRNEQCDKKNKPTNGLPVINGTHSTINQTSMAKTNTEKPATEDKPNPFYISLKDKKFRDCLEPIDLNCKCLTCRNHTKAYIHHLLNVRELLGPLLLTIHNLHHYQTFFETIRVSLRDGNFIKFKNSFEEHLRDES